MLELRLKSRELLGEDVIAAADNNVGSFVSTLHNLQPGFVDLLESSSVLRQSLGNISLSEHSHERLPKALYLKPSFKSIDGTRESTDLLNDLVFEGANVSHDSHLIELVNVIVNFLLDVCNITSNSSRDTVYGPDVELTSIVMSDNIVSELVLELELLVSIISDVFNFFLDLEQVSVEEMLEHESLLIIRDRASSKLNDFFPMAVTNGVFGKTFHDRK